MTTFYNMAELRNAPGCESAGDVANLKTLNPNFEFPADLVRLSAENRSAFVKGRGESLLTPALLSGSSDKISANLADPAKFTIQIASEVKNVFPNAPDAQTNSLTGAAAVTLLAGAGPFRNGCWAALPGQNLRNLAGMVMNKKTGNAAAILVEFSSDYPGPGSDPSTDKPKVTKIGFLSVSTVQFAAGLSTWPDSSCPLN